MITLRAIEPEDLGLLYSIENDPEVWCVGTPSGPYSRYALKQYIAAQPATVFGAGSLRLAICADGRAVGSLDLLDVSPTDRRAEVGIALLAAERGKGYARAALEQLEEYARDILNLRMLFAKVSASANPAARQLFLGCGYVDVATLPAWHYRAGQYEDLLVLQKLI
ncbi:MAG: GNAT family N-acetyltransferase [Alloprevotella sp.]|nr:GNAT family N-acetyltransferase [Alloprevotella sp.]